MKNKKSLSTKEKNTHKKSKVPFQLSFIRFLFKSFGVLFPALAAKKAMQLFMTPKRRNDGKLSPVFNQSVIMGTAYQKTRIRSYMWGHTGKIVLLVHGWESSSKIFESFIIPILNAGYRVVAMDGPAHANSSQKQTNMIDFGDALYTVLKRLEKSGGVYAIVGHSFGGSSLINMLYRKSKPRSLKKIVLIAIPSRIDHIFYDFFKFIRLSSNAVEEFKILMESKFGLKIEGLKVNNWVDNLEIEKVLVVHDRNDKVISYRETESLVNDWKNARLILTEGLGHNRIMKSADVIENIIQYCDQEEVDEPVGHHFSTY
jgi:pimeloyl-ACP methyl ester carboxylesterase